MRLKIMYPAVIGCSVSHVQCHSLLYALNRFYIFICSFYQLLLNSLLLFVVLLFCSMYILKLFYYVCTNVEFYIFLVNHHDMIFIFSNASCKVYFDISISLDLRAFELHLLLPPNLCTTVI